MTLIIPAHNLAIVALGQSKIDLCYHLRGVYFDHSHNMAVTHGNGLTMLAPFTIKAKRTIGWTGAENSSIKNDDPTILAHDVPKSTNCFVAKFSDTDITALQDNDAIIAHVTKEKANARLDITNGSGGVVYSNTLGLITTGAYSGWGTIKTLYSLTKIPVVDMALINKTKNSHAVLADISKEFPIASIENFGAPSNQKYWVTFACGVCAVIEQKV